MCAESGTAIEAAKKDYPRPQLVRDAWLSLDGQWAFQTDPQDVGISEGWGAGHHQLTASITVPFPPESAASGVADTSPNRVFWYLRTITAGEVEDLLSRSGLSAERDATLVLHFGAVDYKADVWVNGTHLQTHEGGHAPFKVTIPGFLTAPGAPLVVVVRAEDDPHCISQPRGKQDWRGTPHAVWYPRTSGIWQTVWLEAVSPQHIETLQWSSDYTRASVYFEVALAHPPLAGTEVRVELSKDGALLGSVTTIATAQRVRGTVLLPVLENGQDLHEWLWSPSQPTLIDAKAEVREGKTRRDFVSSYLGIRTARASADKFMLNGHPCQIRGILSQNFWPDSHLAATPTQLKDEVALIRSLGFNTARVHQKIEDPRFLFWADYLGLMIWEEMPSAYAFDSAAVGRFVSEWQAVIARDSSHPSVIVWVPFNEAWGAQHLISDPAQRAFVRSVYHLTKALDPTRLVVSNDGQEHTRSDLLTLHDYENRPEILRQSYGTSEGIQKAITGVAPNGRQAFVGTAEERKKTQGAPVILSEFGGVSLDRGSAGWGYETVSGPAGLQSHLEDLFEVVTSSTGLAGWCYTQLTDTAQETNGLTDERRVPKLPVETIRSLVQGGTAR